LPVAVTGIRDSKQISVDDFAALWLPYPSRAEQARTACVLQPCDDKMAIHERRHALLNQQKKKPSQQPLPGFLHVGA
jgi:hypothetical protein